MPDRKAETFKCKSLTPLHKETHTSLQDWSLQACWDNPHEQEQTDNLKEQTDSLKEHDATPAMKIHANSGRYIDTERLQSDSNEQDEADADTPEHLKDYSSIEPSPELLEIDERPKFELSPRQDTHRIGLASEQASPASSEAFSRDQDQVRHSRLFYDYKSKYRLLL